MNKQFKSFALIATSALALIGSSALAEQTIGVQAGATAAIATARVNVRVTVPKVVILRVGDANATVSDVNFTVGVGTGVPVAVGNSQAYTGAIAPAGGATTVATTNPTTTAGALTVAAWTNATAGANLSCALSALAGVTAAFATGATAAGVPGTTDITVASVAGAGNLQHPTANLTGCTTAATTSIPTRTTMGGTFTYGTAFTAAGVVSGIYGNVVTYSATTL
jgi:hypothetical protein